MVNALLGIQIIAISFAFFMLYITTLHFKRSMVGKMEYYFWFLVWSAFITFALFPRVLDPLLAKMFVTRAMDLMMIWAFMILAYLGYQNHIGIKDVQKRVEKIVSEEAKKKAKKA
jgi:hypothetical protein